MEKVNLDNLKLVKAKLRNVAFLAECWGFDDECDMHRTWGICELTYENSNKDGYFVSVHLEDPKGEEERKSLSRAFRGPVSNVKIYMRSKTEAKFGLKGRKLPTEGSKEYTDFVKAIEERALRDFESELEKHDAAIIAKEHNKEIERAEAKKTKELKEIQEKENKSNKILLDIKKINANEK